jgi:ATP-dependent RNA helicase RhlE
VKHLHGRRLSKLATHFLILIKSVPLQKSTLPMTFNDLNLNNALRNALEDLQLDTPTPIQVAAFPVIMSGRDVVGVAQTGTGKTFAYLLPILRQLKFSKQKHARVLIVVPTRELVVQVLGEIEKLTTYASIRAKGAYGGVNMNTQKDVLAEGMDILVATPGRLVDLALSRAIKLKTIKQLVIDEVDEMLNLGFLPQLNNLFDLLPERRQSILFSATMMEEVEQLIDRVFDQPEKIVVATSGTSADGVTQLAYVLPNYNSKLNLLHLLLKENQDWTKILLFAPTKKIADQLQEALQASLKEPIGVIHSNKSQNYRLRMVQEFDAGELRILIATDLMARGLDFDGITQVVNLDTPDEPENYIHRVGRTARAAAEGVAITLVSEVPVTQELEYLAAIENLMQQPLKRLPLPAHLELSEELTSEEQVQYQQKNPTQALDIEKHSQGAFHEKKLKNTKVNRAQEKRLARKREKYNSRKRGGKK